ncbi:hypothetical protein [Siminovitchia fordii]|nr:hypothetical protein [Siminovitchia fordii]
MGMLKSIPLSTSFLFGQEKIYGTFIDIKDTLFEKLGIKESIPERRNAQRLMELHEIQKKYKGKLRND